MSSLSHFSCDCVCAPWLVQEPLSPRLATGYSPANHWSTLATSPPFLSCFVMCAPSLVCDSDNNIIIIANLHTISFSGFSFQKYERLLSDKFGYITNTSVRGLAKAVFLTI